MSIFYPFLPNTGMRPMHSIRADMARVKEKKSYAGCPWPTMVGDVAQEVRKFKRPPVLIGHSLGDYIIQKYLEIHQGSGAVLMAAAPPSRAAMLKIVWSWIRLHPVAFLKAQVTLSPHHLFGTLGCVRDFLFSADMPQDRLRDYASRIEPDSYRILLDELVFPPRPQKMKPTPLLVLGAENDVLTPPEMVSETARAYNTDAIIFPNIAHNMMLEEGWQAVADSILEWLRAYDF